MERIELVGLSFLFFPDFFILSLRVFLSASEYQVGPLFWWFVLKQFDFVDSASKLFSIITSINPSVIPTSSASLLIYSTHLEVAFNPIMYLIFWPFSICFYPFFQNVCGISTFDFSLYLRYVYIL